MKAIYRFVFVSCDPGGCSYALVETNIDLSALHSIETSQGLHRHNNNYVEAYVAAANKFFHEQGDRFMKLISKQKEPIEGYPLYYGFTGNY